MSTWNCTTHGLVPDLCCDKARLARFLHHPFETVFIEARSPVDRTTERMIAYRTYAGQLSRLLREAGVEIPESVEVLNPDRKTT